MFGIPCRHCGCVEMAHVGLESLSENAPDNPLDFEYFMSESSRYYGGDYIDQYDLSDLQEGKHNRGYRFLLNKCPGFEYSPKNYGLLVSRWCAERRNTYLEFSSPNETVTKMAERYFARVDKLEAGELRKKVLMIPTTTHLFFDENRGGTVCFVGE